MVSQIPAQQARQDLAFAYTVPSGTFTDADGDPLTLRATLSGGAALPTWLAFDGSRLSGTPDFGDAGTLQLTITASDGRGASVSTGLTITVEQAPAIPISMYSYHNLKSVGLNPQAIPTDMAYVDNAHGWGDFSGKRRLDLFVAATSTTYQLRLPAIYKFYERKKDGSLGASSIRIDGADQACIVPRKVAIADYNKDGRPDAFVACHGLDEPPFPGEPNTVVLSQPDGSYRIRKASPDLGYFHSATSFDANDDGFPDVVVSNFYSSGLGRSLALLVNNRDGTFRRDPNWEFYSGGVFTTEIFDLDEDGKPDLLLGGHEWENAPSRVFLGDGTPNFFGRAPIVLPTVADSQISLDFLATGTGPTRALWVFRVLGQGPDGGPNVYRGRTIQRIAWPSLTQTVPYRDTRLDRGLPWLIKGKIDNADVVSSEWLNDMSTPLQ